MEAGSCRTTWSHLEADALEDAEEHEPRRLGRHAHRRHGSVLSQEPLVQSCWSFSLAGGDRAKRYHPCVFDDPDLLREDEVRPQPRHGQRGMSEKGRTNSTIKVPSKAFTGWTGLPCYPEKSPGSQIQASSP